MISVVIPIYNEEAIVERLVNEVERVMNSCGEPWEVIYVNDGSSDSSLERLLRMQRTDARVTVLDLSRNWGHQPAITAGLNQAVGDAVVTLDGDLQDPPSVILDLIAAWKAGSQVVIAQRKSRRDSFLRRVCFEAFYRVLGRLSDFPIPLNAGIFGLLDRKAVDAIVALSETNRFLPGLRAWVGFSTKLVYYDRAQRAGGEAKQTFGRLLRYGFDAIFSFSYKPLRFSLFIGLVAAFVSLAAIALLALTRILGIGLFGQPVVVGYTTTIISILFLGGIQLMSIGILGEYLGRVYDEVKRRPLYIVRQVHRKAKAARV